MAHSYVERYANDLFISYTHIDDRPFGVDDIQWVSHFDAGLRTRVQQFLGAEVSVWRDPQLTGNDRFGDVLMDEVANTAIIVAVCSPRYVNSKWCVDEITAFASSAQTGPDAKFATRRVIRAMKSYVDPESLPDDLKGGLGYNFYRIEEASKKVREILVGPPDEHWQHYLVLDDLAQDLVKTLRELKDGEDGDPTNTTGRVVYLADAGPDLATDISEIRRDLERRGHKLLPDGPLPLITAEVEEHVRTDLAQCDLAIHPLGSTYGMRPASVKGDERSYGHIQFHLATELSKAGQLHQFVWTPPSTHPAKRAALKLLGDFEDTTLNGNIEHYETTLEDLKSAIVRHLERPVEEDVAAAPAGAGAIVYLMHAREDADATTEARWYLEARGCHVIATPTSADPVADRKAHKENLRLCEAVLIYVGTASHQWLTTAMRELMKAPGCGRTDPLLASAVLLGAPQSDAKNDFESTQVVVLRAPNGHVDELDSFLAAIAETAS